MQHGGVVCHRRPAYPLYPEHLHYRAAAGAANAPLDVCAVTAACMLIRREVLERLGGFDEVFINGYEDVDLSYAEYRLPLPPAQSAGPVL